MAPAKICKFHPWPTVKFFLYLLQHERFYCQCRLTCTGYRCRLCSWRINHAGTQLRVLSVVIFAARYRRAELRCPVSRQRGLRGGNAGLEWVAMPACVVARGRGGFISVFFASTSTCSALAGNANSGSGAEKSLHAESNAD